MQIVAVAEAQYTIPKEFQWVLIMILAIGLQYLVTIYTVTFKARMQVFTPKFLEQFQEEHEKAFPG